MYITNKEIIRCLFDNNSIDHIIIDTNDFGTFCNAFDNKGNIINSLDNVGVTIDNDDFIITEYNSEGDCVGACDIPLIWLLRNSDYPISAIR